jgi:flagellar biosynthesis protein FlhF
VQIKRFEAENISQALKAVKAEFGADAVILETRKLGGRRPGIQVTAAYDPNGSAPNGSAPKGSAPRSDAAVRRALASLPAERPHDVVDPPWAQSASPRNAAPRNRDARSAPAFGASPDPAGDATGLTLRAVQSALSPLREEINAVGADLRAAFDPAAVAAELAQLRALVSDLVLDRRTAGLSGGAREAYRTLAAKGLPKDLAADLAGGLAGGDAARLREALAARIAVAGPLLKDGNPARVLLAGPTGVGKTTTIAKLAAHFAVTEKRRVALVTLDTYRIGAVEQLATYARIIGVPSAVASGPEELGLRLKEHARAELVLIDTAGRSPKDPDHVPGLVAALPPGVQVQLVLPATRTVADHAAILKAYAPLVPRGVVLTKLDEAEQLGAAVHTAVTGGIPVSYLTDGQRIPDDLQLASGARLADLLLGLATTPGGRS